MTYGTKNRVYSENSTEISSGAEDLEEYCSRHSQDNKTKSLVFLNEYDSNTYTLSQPSHETSSSNIYNKIKTSISFININNEESETNAEDWNCENYYYDTNRCHKNENYGNENDNRETSNYMKNKLKRLNSDDDLLNTLPFVFDSTSDDTDHTKFFCKQFESLLTTTPSEPTDEEKPSTDKDISWSEYILDQLKSLFSKNNNGFFRSLEKTVTASYDAYMFLVSAAASQARTLTAYYNKQYEYVFPPFDPNSDDLLLAPIESNNIGDHVQKTIPYSHMSAIFMVLWHVITSVLAEVEKLQQTITNLTFKIDLLENKLTQISYDLTAAQERLQIVSFSRNKLQEWIHRLMWYIPEPVRLQLLYHNVEPDNKSSALSATVGSSESFPVLPVASDLSINSKEVPSLRRPKRRRKKKKRI